MKRIIGQETFDALQCSRCGVCCESILVTPESSETEGGWWHFKGPLGFLEWYGYWDSKNDRIDSFSPQDAMLFYGQLEPYVDSKEQWRYRCGYLKKDKNDHGFCVIYDKRPIMCSDFPYGRPVNTYEECVWNVELIDFEVVLG